MFELIIKNQNGDFFWREWFNSQAELQAWVNVEQTRAYWLPGFTYEVIDHTPPPPSQQELDAIAARNAEIASIKARLAVMAEFEEDFTAAEQLEATMKMVRLNFLLGSYG